MTNRRWTLFWDPKVSTAVFRSEHRCVESVDGKVGVSSGDLVPS